jgi:hypothetical protein
MPSVKLIMTRIFQAVVLTILFLVFFVFGAQAVAGVMPSVAQAEPGPVPAGLGLIIVGAGHALVLMAVILSSRWSGWKLMLAVSFAYYGMVTFMAQIETWYFLTSLTVSPQLLPALFVMGIPAAIFFVPLAVLILGKGIKSPKDTASNESLIMPASQWVWKLAAITLAYLILYFSAGYFIAWQNPELRAFYHGTDPGNFFLQMLHIFQSDPWLTPFQVLRSQLWVLFTLPVIRMTRGKPVYIAMLVGLLLAVPMNIGHIMANPLIPANSVRLSHMLETASSNFVYGLVIVWLLHRSHKSVGDLFHL